MKSRMQWHHSNVDRVLFFSGAIYPEDIAQLDLDPLDRALLDSNPTTAADMLLVLEMLFRRGAEQANGK